MPSAGDYWFLWALASTAANGARAFLAKKVVQDHADISVVNILLPGVMIAISATFVGFERGPLAENIPLAATAALVQGSLFFLANTSRLEALETGAPAHVVFPLSQVSTPIIVLISAALFDEWNNLRDPQRLAGVILAIAATHVLVRWRFDRRGQQRGVMLAVVSMVAGVGATLAAKFTFVQSADVSIFGFILVANMANLVFSIGRFAVAGPSGTGRLRASDVGWGTFMGLLNFAGFACFLRAIQYGPLSLVASITALSTLVPVLLSSWIYGEELTFRRHLALFASCVALVLLAAR
jgi:drug/metabolite transporter (DMT)-like permease